MRILAEGSYQKGAGNDFNVGLAQPTVSGVFHECVNAMFTKLCPKWISFIMTESEKNEIKEHFYQKKWFPRRYRLRRWDTHKDFGSKPIGAI